MIVWMMRFVLVLTVLAGQAFAGAVEFSKDRLTIIAADGRKHVVNVELAVQPEQMTQGLMYRRNLPSDAGMLFDFHESKSVSMWMKNTLIPLDMIFIDDQGVITGIVERTVPQSTEIIPSPGPARAVLEVVGGWAQAEGVKAGDRVVYTWFQKP